MSIQENVNAKMSLAEDNVTNAKKTIGEIPKLVTANHVTVIPKALNLFNATGRLENVTVWMVSIYEILSKT